MALFINHHWWWIFSKRTWKQRTTSFWWLPKANWTNLLLKLVQRIKNHRRVSSIHFGKVQRCDHHCSFLLAFSHGICVYPLSQCFLRGSPNSLSNLCVISHQWFVKLAQRLNIIQIFKNNFKKITGSWARSIFDNGMVSRKRWNGWKSLYCMSMIYIYRFLPYCYTCICRFRCYALFCDGYKNRVAFLIKWLKIGIHGLHLICILKKENHVHQSFQIVGLIEILVVGNHSKFGVYFIQRFLRPFSNLSNSRFRSLIDWIQPIRLRKREFDRLEKSRQFY